MTKNEGKPTKQDKGKTLKMTLGVIATKLFKSKKVLENHKSYLTEFFSFDLEV